MAFDLGDYNEVKDRLVELREKHPEATLQPADPAHPYRIETIGDQTFVVYVAACYRHPEDPRPGVGAAWEPYPGKTSYTKDSELQNAETSAWGRAIVAALAADTHKSVASRDEMRNRTRDRDLHQEPVAAAATIEQVEEAADALAAYLVGHDGEYPVGWATGPWPVKIESVEAMARGEKAAPIAADVAAAVALLATLAETSA